MPPDLISTLLVAAPYLVGAIPFGYLIGRLRGVDLFRAGSGNIGATNAGRVLGRKYGVLVFVLDFLKGAVPVAAIVPLVRSFRPDAERPFTPDDLRVLAAALAFLGHLFPIYLGFRGGKGVATGAGTIAVLVPGPAALAILTWIAVLVSTRIVSLSSLSAVVALVLAWLLTTASPLSSNALPITLYLVAGTAMVFVKHRGNVRRLLAGTESRIGDGKMRQTVVKVLHVLALGLWFGGAAFFNFVTAVSIFDSFKHVVYDGPSDRTAHQQIIEPSASKEQKDALASALAGSAVGPVFPKYFAMQAVCGLVSLVTAVSWWNVGQGRKVHRFRVYVIGLAVLTVVVGWPISNTVSELRLLRFDPNSDTAGAARAAFASWHLVSLFLSFVTVCLAGIGLMFAAQMPEETRAVATRE